MRLRIPVDEGERYRVGEVRFDGNEVFPEEALRGLFGGLVPGEFLQSDDRYRGHRVRPGHLRVARVHRSDDLPRPATANRA